MTHAVGPGGSLQAVFGIFLVAWLVVGVGGWLMIWRARTAERRRIAHRRLVVVASAAFLVFIGAAVALGAPTDFLLIAVPAVILIGWINLRFTTFCDACNRMCYNQLWWRRIRFCPHCGSGLTKPI